MSDKKAKFLAYAIYFILHFVMTFVFVFGLFMLLSLMSDCPDYLGIFLFSCVSSFLFSLAYDLDEVKREKHIIKEIVKILKE